MRGILSFLSVAFFCLFCSIAAMAQAASSAELHVTVKDPGGAVVRNATVTIRNDARNFSRSTTQNLDGEYQFLQLPPGDYSVTVEAAGFAKTELGSVNITVGQKAELPVPLQVASVSETVNVSGETELVETQETAASTAVDERRIDNLPINGRNYINFTLTNSQVARDNAPSIGAAPTSGLNISGQRARSNLVNVDGADATDNAVNGVRSTVSQEAVQEFRIITSGYEPEYGRASGGVVNIITKSGTNSFHGDVFGFLRNRNIQAVNPFSTVPDPAYTRVQAGTAFGGAIKKDKTFYFFSYEITRRHETGFSSIGSNNFGLVNFDASSYFGAPAGTFPIQVTPEQAAFLGNPNPLIPITSYQAYAFTAGAASGIAINGKYPASFALLPPALVPAGLQQFPSSCNPALAGAANFYCTGLPASFKTLASQVGNFPVFEGTSLWEAKIDQAINDRNHMSFRVSVSPSTVTGIEVNGQNQTFGQNAYSRTSEQTYRDFAGVVEDNWVLANNKVNEFRFQYARRGLLYNYSNAPGGSDVAVNIPGFAFFGREPYSFIQRVENRYQFTDNFSWTLGRHNTKFGVDFNYIPTKATFTVNYGGVYDFGSNSIFPAPFPAFNPVQSYGLGIPADFIQGIGNPRDSFSNKPLGLYWQDSWQITHNLTMNYGLRYDIEFPPQLKPLNPAAVPAYDFLGLQKGIKADTTMFQPRIGLAWDPKGDGKSVIRASYGLFFDHPLLGLYFLGDASDGSTSGQLAFPGTGLCEGAGNPANLNGIAIFQGNLTTSPNCAPGPAALNQLLGYMPDKQQFDAFLPNSLFINQNYITAGFPLGFQPFGYPQSKNFVYARSQQVNLSLEKDLGGGFVLNLMYNFNGGRHLNRPINANTSRGDLLVANLRAAVAAGALKADGVTPWRPTDNPLLFDGCGVGAGGPYVPASLVNFFRPSGLNPSIANAYLAQGGAQCVGLAQQVLQAVGLNSKCDPTTLSNCVPFGDMDANYSNGSSVYHGFTTNLRKRFSKNYEFLFSYTWSHAIDDSTDLQSPLAPQDSYFPSLERSNSAFDQRHRLVFSGMYQTGQLHGDGAFSKVFSNITVSPIIDVNAGRPFLIITGDDTNFQLATSSARPNVVSASAPPSACGTPTVASKYSPTGYFQEPCYVPYATPGGPTPTLAALDGNLGRNAGTGPWTVFNDLSISKKVNITERTGMLFRMDVFNLANRFNVSGVNVLWTGAGQPTAAYDPRQFQFALKFLW